MIFRGDHQTWMLPCSHSAMSSSRVSRKERAKKRPKLEKNNFYFLFLSPGEEVPDVMVVEIVETLKAFLVELFWQGGARLGAFHLGLEEVEGGRHEDAGENHEDQCRPGQPLPRQILHEKIEGEVHGNVGEEDEEEDRGEVRVGDEKENHAEENVDNHEDNEKPKPERKFLFDLVSSVCLLHLIFLASLVAFFSI